MSTAFVQLFIIDARRMHVCNARFAKSQCVIDAVKYCGLYRSCIDSILLMLLVEVNIARDRRRGENIFT